MLAYRGSDPLYVIKGVAFMSNTKTRDDADLDAQVLGSGNPETQDDTRAALIDRIGEKAYYSDPERFWTAQHGGMPPTGDAAHLGPQVYLREQLPDPAVARAAGIPAQQIPEYLVLDTEDPRVALSHPRGPEPGELFRLVKHQAVNEHLLADLEDHPSGAGVLTLTSHSMAEIRNAQEGTQDGDREVEPEEGETTSEKTEPDGD